MSLFFGGLAPPLAVAPAPGTPPFNPSQLPGITDGWWDASKIPPVADGTSLSNFPAVSHHSYDLGQATPANQGVYRTNRFNGLPAVSFNGSQWFRSINGIFLTADGGAVNQPFNICGVVQSTATTPPQCLWGFNGSLEPQTAVAPYQMTAGIAFQSFSGPPPTDTNLHALIFTFNGASSLLNGDGTTYPVKANPGTNGTFQDYLNVGTGFSFGGFIGYMCEFFIVSGTMSATDTRNVLGYFHTKWGTP